MSEGVQLIDDGFTVDGYIDETEQHGAVELTYRPVLTADYNKYIKKVNQIEKKGPVPDHKPEPLDQLTSSLIAKHVLTWDVTGSDGEVADVVPSNVSKLPQLIYAKLLEMITLTAKDGTLDENLGN